MQPCHLAVEFVSFYHFLVETEVFFSHKEKDRREEEAKTGDSNCGYEVEHDIDIGDENSEKSFEDEQQKGSGIVVDILHVFVSKALALVLFLQFLLHILYVDGCLNDIAKGLGLSHE